MNTYLNIITGKIIVAKDLNSIKGNVVNRGLSKEYIKLNTIAIEYTRLTKDYQRLIEKGIYSKNMIKAIKDFEGFMNFN